MGSELSRNGPASLVDVGSLETLSSLYSAWEGLRLDHALHRQAWAEERQRLDGEGSFLVGAVRAAGQEPSAPPMTEALTSPRSGAVSLQSFLTEAEARLARSRASLDERVATGEREQALALEAVQARIQSQLKRYAASAPPSLVLHRRPVGKERAVLHVERLGPDAALMLLHLSSGQIAARYDFLTDDRTDSADREGTTFYPEPQALDERSAPARFPELSRPAGRVSPVKGFIPLFLTRADGSPVFFRLLQRGAVLEAEILDGDAFRSILATAEAELLAGQLLRWKLSGALQLRIEMG